jgi:Tudor domain
MAGKAINVVVLSGEGPEDFYVIQEKRLTLEMRLQKIFQEKAENASHPEEIKVDETYLAQHPSDKQWYRVKVTRAASNGQIFQVFMIDYGNVFRVSETKIKNLDGIMLKDMEPRVLKCCLEDKEQLLKDIYKVNLRFQFLVAHR